MNAPHEWIEKSLRLANEENYLDRLQLIYPVVPSAERPLSPADKESKIVLSAIFLKELAEGLIQTS
ncbi:MAG: hypothetical protein RMK19_09080 [Bacteroidia bacterium]|nr:hypothetical protein [Bacteroidia bacterium]